MSNNRLPVFLVLLISSRVLFPPSAQASMSAPLSELPQEFTAKMGLWSGTIHTAKNIDYELSLGTFALSFPKDLSSQWERQYQLEFWINPDSKQVVKQTLEANWNFCVFGGTRRYQRQYRREEITQVHHDCIGLVLRLGLGFYDIPSPEVGISPLSGRSLETKAGMRYFQQLTKNTDIGIEWTTSLFSVTASREQIEASGNGFSMAIRALI